MKKLLLTTAIFSAQLGFSDDIVRYKLEPEKINQEFKWIEESHDPCGDDDRKEVLHDKSQKFPYLATGSIRVTFPDGTAGGCTAFLVGPRLVMTAAHCAVKRTTSGPIIASSLTYVNAYHRHNRPAYHQGYTIGDYFHISTKYVYEGRSWDDWAIVELVNDDIYRQVKTYISLEVGEESESAFTIGYPGSAGEWAGYLYRMFETPFDEVKVVDRSYFGQIDTSQGMSGGPLLVNRTDGTKAIGLVRSGWKNCIYDNQFTRIEQRIYDYVKKVRDSMDSQD